MWIGFAVLFGVVLVQHGRGAVHPARNSECAVYCQEVRSMKLHLNTNLYILCRCGSGYPTRRQATYGVLRPYTMDRDSSDDLLKNYGNPYTFLPGDQTRDLNVQILPGNVEYGSFVDPLIIYKKHNTVSGQLQRNVIQSKISTLKKKVKELTRTNKENELTNDHEANAFFDNLNEFYPYKPDASFHPKFVETRKMLPNYLDDQMDSNNIPVTGATSKLNGAVPLLKAEAKSQMNDDLLDNDRSGDKVESLDQSEQLHLLKRSSPLYWSQKKYSVENTIPEGSPLIMDMGLQNNVKYRTEEDNSNSAAVVESLNNFTTRENFKTCLNLLELQNYQSSDNTNKNMTTSITNLVQGKYANYSKKDISDKILVTCNETFAVFRTGVEEINNKENVMFDKMKTLRSVNPRIVHENTTEGSSEALIVDAPREYWIDATTEPLKSIPNDTQVLPELLPVTKKGSFHPLVRGANNGLVQNNISAKDNQIQTTSPLELTTEDRPVIMEKDRKVHKLIISENKAGLQIEFGEFEKIDNKDFVSDNKASKGLATRKNNNASAEQINEVVKDHTTLENAVTNPKKHHLLQWPLHLDDLYITHQGLKMPLNFVPNANGKVDILIDGQYICDQLLKKQDESLLLLKIICNSNQKELQEKMKSCSQDNAQNILG